MRESYIPLTGTLTCKDMLCAGLAGLALTATLNLTQLMNWMVRTLTELEMGMNSVERILEYTEERGEAPAHIPSAR